MNETDTQFPEWDEFCEYFKYNREVLWKKLGYKNVESYDSAFSRFKKIGKLKPELILLLELFNDYKTQKRILSTMQPVELCPGKWIYKGCFIQKGDHPMLAGQYRVFKNDKLQTHVDRCNTFKQAKKLCEKNECTENVLPF